MKHSAYRFIYKVIIAFAIALLFKFLFFRIPEIIGFDLIPISIIVFIIWEVNIKIDKWLDKKYSWIKSPKKRLISQSIAFTLFTSVTLFLLMYTLHQIRFGDGRLINRRMEQIFFPSLFFALAIVAVYICYQFFNAWKKSLIDIERYKTETANAQLQNLKSQINPHFLFNNLSVLTSLVYQDQDKAAAFISELSKVYRYVLDNKNAGLVTLKEELNFLQHYIYLLKIRFENAVVFNININEDQSHYYLPPMCIQMLVENSIQHNEASQAMPLHISIYTVNTTLCIENNIQARTDLASSSRTGLKNIQSRFEFFSDNKVEVFNNGKVFKVTLPLIIKQ